MKQRLLYLFTRTPLHVGAGTSVGAIDQPIQREKHTLHPIIPGSSIKGVMRDAATALLERGKVKDMFGPDLTGEDREDEARAGNITFGEARVLAFPVRSARGAFAYITCPLVLKRFQRDSALASDPGKLPDPEEMRCYAGNKVKLPNGRVVLEEYSFECSGEFPKSWEDVLKPLIDDPVWQEVSGRLVLMSDGDFSHFVSTATEISQHIKMDLKTGAVAHGALFSLESVPSETLFFASVTCHNRKPFRDKKDREAYATDCDAELARLLTERPILQFGGNSTTGRGFCSVTLA